MNNNSDIIGVFDSGIGGLTVLYEIAKALPHERFVYYGDGESLPLGEKSREEIIEITDRAVKFLVDKGAKVVVLACNTATAAAKEYIRAKYDTDIVAIEPAVKPAASTSRAKKIGIIATRSTIEGEPLKKLCERWGRECEIALRVGKGLVEIVEKDTSLDQNDIELLASHINPLIDKGVDKIILGCTHYPFLRREIEAIIASRDIELINPAPFVAKRVAEVLKTKNLLSSTQNSEDIEFYSPLGDEYIGRIEKKYRILKESNNE